jgi:hypothetical protein
LALNNSEESSFASKVLNAEKSWSSPLDPSTGGTTEVRRIPIRSFWQLLTLYMHSGKTFIKVIQAVVQNIFLKLGLPSITELLEQQNCLKQIAGAPKSTRPGIQSA